MGKRKSSHNKESKKDEQLLQSLHQTSQPDEALFFIDVSRSKNTSGSSKVASKLDLNKPAYWRKEAIKERHRNRLETDKFQHLPGHSGLKTSAARSPPVVFNRFLKKAKKGKLDKKRKREETTDGSPYDIWEEPESEEESLERADKDFSTTKQSIKRKVFANEETNEAPTPLCKPGESYNPTTEDHQDVLGEAIAMTIRQNDNERLLIQKIKVPKKSKFEEELLNEAKLNSTQKKYTKEEPAAPAEKVKERKTEKERKKEKIKKELNRELRIQNSQQRKMKDIDKIPQILQQIEEEERKSKERRQKRQELLSSKPKRLGKYVLEKQPPKDLLLTNELPGRLRSLKTKTNLIEERFVNFQSRNLIEPRVPVAKYRKYDKIVYEKRS